MSVVIKNIEFLADFTYFEVDDPGLDFAVQTLVEATTELAGNQLVVEGTAAALLIVNSIAKELF